MTDNDSREKIGSDDLDSVINNLDTTSDFEVECPGVSGMAHDWLSETGMSEETPLFGDKSPPPPEDKYRRVWLVFYMLGMTTLLPWNFFIAVNDYWNFKFRDVVHNSTNHTVLQKEFTSYLGEHHSIQIKVQVIRSFIH